MGLFLAGKDIPPVITFNLFHLDSFFPFIHSPTFHHLPSLFLHLLSLQRSHCQWDGHAVSSFVQFSQAGVTANTHPWCQGERNGRGKVSFMRKWSVRCSGGRGFESPNRLPLPFFFWSPLALSSFLFLIPPSPFLYTLLHLIVSNYNELIIIIFSLSLSLSSEGDEMTAVFDAFEFLNKEDSDDEDEGEEEDEDEEKNGGWESTVSLVCYIH